MTISCASTTSMTKTGKMGTRAVLSPGCALYQSCRELQYDARTDLPLPNNAVNCRRSFSLAPVSRVLCATISRQAQIEARAAIYQSTQICKIQSHINIRRLLRHSASQRDGQLVQQPPSRRSVKLLCSIHCRYFQERNVVSTLVKEKLDPCHNVTIHKLSSSGTKPSR